MIVVTAEYIIGARMGLQHHPLGMQPAERVRAGAAPGIERWADPERYWEAMWAISRGRYGE
jgi:hypothetical protein